LRRRHLLLGGLAAAGAGALAVWRFWPEQGLWNPCFARLPRRLAGHELVKAAWEGVDPAQVWDSHAHLIGTGDSGSGIYVNPGMESLLNPGQYARRLFFLNAGCAHGGKKDGASASVDRAYVERMHNLIDGMRRGFRMLLFAFERAHDEHGAPDLARTPFHVPDAYARDTARRHPEYFEWAASIHPYAPDAVERLKTAIAEGARAVKWLPSAMGIDPASPRCDPFYAVLAKAAVPLIAHAGEERAVLGREMHELGNPLRLRRALDHGVRVVVAHCASMGSDRDTDAGPNGPMVESFRLFARLMGEARYDQALFGDLSAMTQVNRAGPALERVIREEAWHGRLLNGSDYPLPGVMPIFSVDFLASIRLIDEAAAPVLKEIRLHNPLLFDFVLKRHLRAGAARLSRRVFETRRFFAPL
jgi:predicted TIM-barrel fold metal-dependent hydrolase